MSSSWSLSAVWLGTAVALTTATQLRLGIPVGPGELMLVGWIFVSLVLIVMQGRLVVSSTARVLLAFWAASFVLLLAGWLVGLLIGHASDSAARDFLAYCLVATVVLMVVLKPGGLDEVRTAIPVALLVSILALAFLLLSTFAFESLGPLETLKGGRFRGWSRNPNQVALAMSPVPFLVLYGLGRSRRTSARAAHILLLAAAVAVGMASLSDGLFLAWATGTVLMVSYAWLLGLFRGRATFGRGVIRYVIAPVLVLGLLIIGGHTAYLRVQAILEGIYQVGGQGSLRLTLWRHGLQAIAESPLFGLGPGPHSGFSGPFGDFEAHNTFIDWGAATGVAGLLVYISLLIWVARRATREPTLLAALAAMVVLSVSGFNLRHPIFWLYLLFIAVAGREKLNRDGGRAGGATGGNAPPALAPRSGVCSLAGEEM